MLTESLGEVEDTQQKHGCLDVNIKLLLELDLQDWSSHNYGVLLHGHYSQVHFDLEQYRRLGSRIVAFWLMNSCNIK